MPDPSVRSAIRLRGVRHNNLKNFDLDLPLNRLVVITGLSGSGKSSLAFDTLFAEGQRRYIETFSPYARQFFDRMDKPQIDSIEGIPPAVAIEQRNAVRTTRSTVGTMTEICDYMKVLWPHVSRLHCRQCGRPVKKDSPQQIFAEMANLDNGLSPEQEILVTFDLPVTEKLSLAESLALIAKQGYQRLLLNGEVVRIDDLEAGPARIEGALTVIQDRVRLASKQRARFVEACEQAYHFGKGKLAIRALQRTSGIDSPRLFSNRLHCARCDIEYRDPSPALFSFNHPLGACTTCKGFGRVISIDYNLVMPDRSRTLAEGVVKPWFTGTGAESQRDLMRACRQMDIPTNVPFEKLPAKWQRFVIDGDPEYGIDKAHEWPRAWYGVKGYFRWLESKSYKMHVRVLLSRYRAYTTCPGCSGARFRPETLLYRLQRPGGHRQTPRDSQGVSAEITLADFYQLPIRDAGGLIDGLVEAREVKGRNRAQDPVRVALDEVRSRIGFLNEVGLGYLTLDRATRSLSGGETERVNLTTCLGTRLVNTLFVLDEPSVGLHPSDTERLVRILQELRSAGNTVVVVEHEAAVMRAADQIIDLGPGHGATGGQVVFQGPFASIHQSKQSLTGAYLSGRKRIEIPIRRPVLLSGSEAMGRIPQVREPATPSLKLSNVIRNNLQNVTVELPLGRFVCLTGVSGSGKTTLLREVLLPTLDARLRSRNAEARMAAAKASERFDEDPGESDDSESGNPRSDAGLTGHEHLERVILVDQSILGKTPRSNPAVYIGAFDDIREVFAQSDAARQLGLNASAFSFNSAQGQCERCRGAGFEKIEMQFLSDVFIRCPDCGGRRYRPHILEVKIESQPAGSGSSIPLAWSIADMLDATTDEAIDFLSGFPQSRPARSAVEGLRLLQEVGLGYLRLGQPINTLSGGESQRLKLVRHLAEASLDAEARPAKGPAGEVASNSNSGTLFLFDEPTTGLHFEDVRLLLSVFQRIVDAGHSVFVIEHNLDVIKSADWIVDLGPGAGDEGGRVVAAGTPEQVALSRESRTGSFLRDILPLARKQESSDKARRIRLVPPATSQKK